MGREETVKRVKQYAEYCRARSIDARQAEAGPPRGFPFHALEGGSFKALLRCPVQGPAALAQVARLGRSMPLPTHKQQGRALIEHCNELTAGPHEEIPVELLDAFYYWTRTWGAGKGAALRDEVTVNFSSAAAESVSRARGGQREELRLLAAPHFEAIREALAIDDIDFRVEEGDYAGIYSEEDDLEIITQAAIERVRADIRAGRRPDVRAAVVPELGAKSRIVTAGEAHWVVIGDAIRKCLWPALEAEPRIDLSGRRDVAGTAAHLHDEVAKALTGAEAVEFYSADLTAATDLMPHDLIQAIWRGLMEGLGVSDDDLMFTAGLALLGPVNLHHPDLDDLDRPGKYAYGVTHKGCMMGFPLSWYILNLYNLACADLALSAERGRFLAEVAPRLVGAAPAVVRGDDLCSAHTPAEADRYERIIRATGGRANLSKSYRSRKGFILAERTFLVTTARTKCSAARSRLGTVVVRPGVHPRAPLLTRAPDAFESGALGYRSIDPRSRRRGAATVVGLTMLSDVPVRHLMPSPDSEGLPAYVTLPPAASAVVDEIKDIKRREAICYGILSVNAPLVRQFNRFKIPIFYPRELGGAGFPHPKGFGSAIRSAGGMGHLRATLAMTTFTRRARQAYQLDRDPWICDRQVEFERSRAQTGLIAEERRAAESGQLGLATSVPLEDAVAARAAEGQLWAEVMLPQSRELASARRGRRGPRLSSVRKGLSDVFNALAKVHAKFDPKFLANPRIDKETWMDRVAMAKGSSTVYRVVRPSGRRVVMHGIRDTHREIRAEREMLKGGWTFGGQRDLRQNTAAGLEGGEIAVPVPTQRAGATLWDVLSVSCKRARKRKKGNPRL
ncbi:RNA-dependent RNA polymerase [Hubei narna-like virus 21]|uniref:RNA-dependent RNA polymerase n=1 Tax=Hubei narna-like virus 21 TaxID=1922952 RepID=UPI000909F841|nr:RNA-dependent RNA polymerase [Hubei narna-like virus 21]APG77148.1 RNA-dependent RNA polymerase [Hubei narna-like virus 21]